MSEHQKIIQCQYGVGRQFFFISMSVLCFFLFLFSLLGQFFSPENPLKIYAVFTIPTSISFLFFVTISIYIQFWGLILDQAGIHLQKFTRWHIEWREIKKLEFEFCSDERNLIESYDEPGKEKQFFTRLIIYTNNEKKRYLYTVDVPNFQQIALVILESSQQKKWCPPKETSDLCVKNNMGDVMQRIFWVFCVIILVSIGFVGTILSPILIIDFFPDLKPYIGKSLSSLVHTIITIATAVFFVILYIRFLLALKNWKKRT